MLVGLADIMVYLPDCHSLKDKRSILKGFKLGIRKKYNISISEIGYKGSWKKSMIGIACISDNRKIIDQIMNHLITDIKNHNYIQLIDFNITIN